MRVAWWCLRGHKNRPHDPTCAECGILKVEKYAQVKESERAVVYYNSSTGEHRTPPRADVPIPDNYAKAGFEKKEITCITQWERKSGSVHEASTFNSGNEFYETPPPTPRMSKETRESLITDVRDAVASGPWTDSTGVTGLPQV